MKKSLALFVVTVLTICCVCSLCACDDNGTTVNPDKEHYVVGICQLVTHAALDKATEGFKDGLKAELAKENRTVEFDYQNASGESNLCTTIVNNFVAQKVDLIMANATPALQAAANATLTIPILGTSVTEYGVALDIDGFSGVVGGNISGTSDLAPLDKQAQMVKDLIPSANKVAVLYCSSEANSAYQYKVISEELTKLGLTAQKFTFTDSNDIAMVLEQAITWCDVLYLPTDNMVASNAEIINNKCSLAQIPVICGEEGPCAICGVATLSISYYNLGYTTGVMAANVLLGKQDISTLPIGYDNNPVYKYNAEICTLLGITVPQEYVAIGE